MQDFEINDDLVVDENYVEVETTPRPPLPGNYVLKVDKFDFKRNQDGELVLWKDSNGDPKYPVFSIQMAEIVDPFEYGRKVGLFQDVPTNPNDFREPGKKTSQAADLLRAINADAVASNTGEVINQLSGLLTGGMTFRARIDYTGYDSEYAKAQIEAQGGKGAFVQNKKGLNKIYDSAKVRGYRNIIKANTAAGKGNLPISKWVGPSGNVIDVRPTVTVFYPASEESVKLGPDKGLVS